MNEPTLRNLLTASYRAWRKQEDTHEHGRWPWYPTAPVVAGLLLEAGFGDARKALALATDAVRYLTAIVGDEDKARAHAAE